MSYDHGAWKTKTSDKVRGTSMAQPIPEIHKTIGDEKGRLEREMGGGSGLPECRRKLGTKKLPVPE